MKVVEIISGIVKNLRTGRAILDFGEAQDVTSQERCCGPDCCNDVYYWKDNGISANKAKYVSYVKNGTLVTVTKAAYEADKLNGFA